MRVAFAAAAVLALGALAHPGHAGDTTPCSVPGARTAPAHGGWRVQLDPETGTYAVPAPDGVPVAANAEARAPQITVQPGTTAAGGYKVRLGDDTAATQEQR